MLTDYEITAGNTGLAKVAVQCSVDTFEVNKNLVLRINISGEKPAHRKYAKRCTPLLTDYINTLKYILISTFFLTIGCKPLSGVGNREIKKDPISKNTLHELNGIYSNQSDTVYGKVKDKSPFLSTDLNSTAILDQLLFAPPTKSYRGMDGEIIKPEEKWIKIEFTSRKKATISMFYNEKFIFSKNIHGKSKKGYFYLRPKVIILPLFPLFFGYSFERTRIGKSGDSLIIDSSENTWIVAFISGVIHRGYTSSIYNKRVQ